MSRPVRRFLVALLCATSLSAQQSERPAQLEGEVEMAPVTIPDDNVIAETVGAPADVTDPTPGKPYWHNADVRIMLDLHGAMVSEDFDEWQLVVQLEDLGGESPTALAFLDDALFIGTNRGSLYAVEEVFVPVAE